MNFERFLPPFLLFSLGVAILSFILEFPIASGFGSATELAQSPSASGVFKVLHDITNPSFLKSDGGLGRWFGGVFAGITLGGDIFRLIFEVITLDFLVFRIHWVMLGLRWVLLILIGIAITWYFFRILRNLASGLAGVIRR